MQAEVKATKDEDMAVLVESETRIILLYSTMDEADQIMKWNNTKKLTGQNYVWIVTQSVIGESVKDTQGVKADAKATFPIGMLGMRQLVSL